MADVIIKFIGDDADVSRVIAKIKKDSDAAADSATKGFEGVGDAITDAFSPAQINGFGGAARAIPALINPITLSIVAVGLAIKTAFDLSLAGEQLKAAEAQFDSFANSAGLSGQSIRASLEDASGGLVDIDNLLKNATGAVINLGENAAKLPEILGLARQATFALGGSIEERFNGIVNAIEAGNIKALRQQGIFLDSKAVFRDYAANIGVSADKLDLAQKQQALLNAALKTGAERFSGVSESLTPLASNLDKSKVAFDQIFDNFKNFANDKFGETFKSLGDAITRALQEASKTDSVSTAKQNIDSLSTAVDELNRRSAVLKERISKESGVFSDDPLASSQQEALLISLQRQLDITEGQIVSFNSRIEAIASKPKPSSGNTADKILGLNDEQIAERAAKIEKFKEDIDKLNLAARSSGVQNDITNLNSITDQNAFELASKASLNEQLDILDQQREAAIKESNARINLDSGLRNQAELAINADFNNKKEALEIAAANRAKALKKQRDDQAFNATSTALGEIATLQQNATGELAQIGKAAAITKATIDGYVAVQSAFANVPYPFNFAAAALVGVAAAANVAKIAAVGGGGAPASTSAFSPPSAGGGVSADPSSSPLPGIVSNTPERNADTGVVVNIQGDVLDSEESGLRIVRLINESFDKKGVSVRGGSFA